MSISPTETWSRQSRTDEVADRMLEEIRTGRWVRGELLPPERVLAVKFGVSRGSLRKALKKLENERVITPEQQVGWRIASHEPSLQCPGDPLLLIGCPPEVLGPLGDIVKKGAATHGLNVRIEAASFEQMKDGEGTLRPDALEGFGSILVYSRSVISPRFLEPFQAVRLPVCCIQLPARCVCDAVATDRLLGNQRVVDRLDEMGHQAVLYVGCRNLEANCPIFEMMRTGFQAACRQRGVVCHLLLSEFNCWFRPEDRQMFRERWRTLSRHARPPTAIYAEIGHTTLPYLFGYLRELGVRVPQDVSMIGSHVHKAEGEPESPLLPQFACMEDDLPALVSVALRKLVRRTTHPDEQPALTLVPAVFDSGETLSPTACATRELSPDCG